MRVDLREPVLMGFSAAYQKNIVATPKEYPIFLVVDEVAFYCSCFDFPSNYLFADLY